MMQRERNVRSLGKACPELVEWTRDDAEEGGMISRRLDEFTTDKLPAEPDRRDDAGERAMAKKKIGGVP